MSGRPWSPWTFIVLPVVLIVVLGAIWAAAPEDARGALLLGGAAITAVVYGVAYVIQRRIHW